MCLRVFIIFFLLSSFSLSFSTLFFFYSLFLLFFFWFCLSRRVGVYKCTDYDNNTCAYNIVISTSCYFSFVCRGGLCARAAASLSRSLYNPSISASFFHSISVARPLALFLSRPVFVCHRGGGARGVGKNTTKKKTTKKLQSVVVLRAADLYRNFVRRPAAAATLVFYVRA